MATRPRRRQRRWRNAFLLLVLCVSSSMTGSAIASSRAQCIGVHCGITTTAVSSGPEIFVSPAGTDANPGTQTKPVRTLARAQALVRTMNSDMRSDMTVFLEPGTYRLVRPLVFAPRDSGTNGFQVIWTSTPDASTLISGSRQIGGWTLWDKARNIWIAKVPAGTRTRQIYVNGMRATMASGYVRGRVVGTPSGYQIEPNSMSTWKPTGMDFVYLGEEGPWTDASCPVSSITGQSVNMAEPCYLDSTHRYQNYVTWGSIWHPSYVEGAFHLLGRPGQFYLDTNGRKLYYVPRPGQNMNTADVEVPMLQTLVRGVGTAGRPVRGLAFQNLTFAYATWLQASTSDGFSEIQANYTITGNGGYGHQGLCQYAVSGTCPYGSWTKEPGNLEFGYDRQIDFLNDRFVHLGAAALDLGDGSQRDSIVGSVFTDISGNGIEVGGVDKPMASGGYATWKVTIADNHLYGMPVEYEGGIPILVGYASNTLITHNQIDDVPYSAISIGWGGWPDKAYKPAVPNMSRYNTVSDNLISNFMQVLADGGGIYTQGITGYSMQSGEHVTGNVVHGELGWSRAMHSDDSATYVTYTDNVLYDNPYDWGSNHYDTTTHDGRYDAELLTRNFWEQGDQNLWLNGFTEEYNTVIAAPEQAPQAILDAAGIEPAYRSILGWTPAGTLVPNAPQSLHVLYALDGSVYITWKPSFAQGSSPVTFYTVQACSPNPTSAIGQCGNPSGTPVTISADAFNQQGYAVIPGLHDGSWYSFQVTASNAEGPSTPSIPTTYIRPTNGRAHTPGKVGAIIVHPASRAVVLQWYPPVSAHGTFDSFARRPVLSYAIHGSDGTSLTSSSLSQMYISNSGGRTTLSITGLTPGKAYRFSVAGTTEGGTGPAKWSAWVTPTA